MWPGSELLVEAIGELNETLLLAFNTRFKKNPGAFVPQREHLYRLIDCYDCPKYTPPMSAAKHSCGKVLVFDILPGWNVWILINYYTCCCVTVKTTKRTNLRVLIFVNPRKWNGNIFEKKQEAQGPCTGHRSIIAILHCFSLHEKNTN